MKIKQNLHTSIVRNENNSGIHLSVCRGSTEFMKSYEELWQVQIHCRSDMVWHGLIWSDTLWDIRWHPQSLIFCFCLGCADQLFFSGVVCPCPSDRLCYRSVFGANVSQRDMSLESAIDLHHPKPHDILESHWLAGLAWLALAVRLVLMTLVRPEVSRLPFRTSKPFASFEKFSSLRQQNVKLWTCTSLTALDTHTCLTREIDRQTLNIPSWQTRLPWKLIGIEHGKVKTHFAHFPWYLVKII